MYAHADQDLMQGLKKHLQPLEKRGDVAIWHAGEIFPGQNWDKTIKDQINSSDIILLIISINFLNSEYIEKEELKAAYSRHEEGQAIIVPIIAKPCIWDADIRIGALQVLPQGARPISSWEDIDEAWVSVVRGIKTIIEQRGNLFTSRSSDLSALEINTPQFLGDIYKNKVNIDLNAQYDFEGPNQSIKAITTRIFRSIEESPNGIKAVPSGFVDLDRITLGWQPSELVVIAGESGIGKSSFALCLALNAAENFHNGVAIFSLEASSDQLIQRFISIKSEITISKLRSGNLEDYERVMIQDSVDSFSKIPIFIDDTPEVNIFELGARCRQLKLKHDIDLVIIDCLQLMTFSTEEYNIKDKEYEITSIVRGLKKLAKEINVSIIATSQTDAQTGIRGGNRIPKISDLGKYRSIENDADIIIFIHRPEYNQILEDENGRSLKGIADIIVAKHRNGALDTARLKFDNQFGKFKDFIEHAQIGKPKIKTSKMTEKDIPF